MGWGPGAGASRDGVGEGASGTCSTTTAYNSSNSYFVAARVFVSPGVVCDDDIPLDHGQGVVHAELLAHFLV